MSKVTTSNYKSFQGRENNDSIITLTSKIILLANMVLQPQQLNDKSRGSQSQVMDDLQIGHDVFLLSHGSIQSL